MKTIILEVKREMLQFNTITMEVDDDQYEAIMEKKGNPDDPELYDLLYGEEEDGHWEDYEYDGYEITDITEAEVA